MNPSEEYERNMNETIEGLHTCKPGNAPSVGQIKSFLVTNEVSTRTGNNWTKIRNETPDKGGKHYRIVSVRPTGRKDERGNVSFNLEIEESGASAPPPQNSSPAHQNDREPASTGRPFPPPSQSPLDTPQQHLMRAANLYNLCLACVDTVIRDAMRGRGIDLHEHPAWMQAITTTLFIQAKDQGYISHMSDKEQKPKERKDPY